MQFATRTATAIAFVLTSVAAAAAFPATSTTNLNVRSGPGTGYPVVGSLQSGETVDVTQTRGNWYEIAGQGWANGSYLESGGAVPAPVVSYGTPAFYYGDDPYYWDAAGYYWFWSNGVRRRVAYDWWRDHHRNIRWDDRWRHRDWRGPGPERRADRRIDRRVDRQVDRRADRRIDRRTGARPLVQEGRASAVGRPGGARMGGGGPRYHPQGHMGGRGGHMGGGGHFGGRR